MIDETLEELRDGLNKALDSLKRELARLRTGRASVDMLESIRVDYYGTPTPIPQMASVTVPEARMLVVKPWDRSSLTLIEKAIQTSPLDLNPQNDGEIIRIPIPMLTEQRRKELVKLAREHGEKCRVAMRAARHEAKDMLASLAKEGEASEDDVDRALKKVEEIVKDGNAKVDEILAKKEKDVMEL
ncbi:MAG: ribosome recycling factor [Sandaracinaceae bacterium]|nr:ribosome recycling factor [Sandaracinaceae bacterium]